MLDLIADSYPKSSLEVLALPLLIVAIAFVVWYAGILLEARLEIKHVKWVALVPILIGLWMGFQNVMAVRDPWYNSIVDGDKIQAAHYITLFLPILAVAGMVAWHMIGKRRDTAAGF